MNILPIQLRQRQKEDFYFQAFCDGFPEIKSFVQSVPSGNGAPDFILQKEGIKISLDLTAYFIDSDESDKSSLVKLEESKLGWIIKRAQKEFEATSAFKLNVAFIKNHHFSVRLLNEDAIQDMVKNIVALIASYLMHEYTLLKDSHPWFRWKELREFGLENIFSSIYMYIFPSDWQSLWAEAGGGGVPSIVHSNLQAIVEKKEIKVQKYLQYGNEAWLLIHTEMMSGMASWVVIQETDEELHKWVLKTSFNRVFFLHSSRNRVIEFQVER
jgi:hypothetical protein